MSNSAQTSASSRIAALLDENSFVEVGAYITARNTDFNMADQETPADGVITGYGTIDGCLVYVYSQDGTVLGGSIGEMHAKKICNVYSMAMKMGAPVIGLIDCAGLRLQEATDALDGFGRSLVSILPSSNEEDLSYGQCQDDLNRMCDGIAGCAGDAVQALSMISDDNFLIEVKKDYEPSMVTAFIRLNGVTVGCVANRTEISGEDGKKENLSAEISGKGCEKAADFITFCDAFNIPALTLVNVNGYRADICSEKVIARAAGRLTYAYANASVPKVTVVTKEALGSAYLTMGSKSLGADIVYAWEGASIGMMDAEQAAKIMYAKEIEGAEDAVALIQEKAGEYASLQSSALSAARRGYVDDIIKAEETRQRVIAAFEMLFTKSEDRPFKKHGTV